MSLEHRLMKKYVRRSAVRYVLRLSLILLSHLIIHFVCPIIHLISDTLTFTSRLRVFLYYPKIGFVAPEQEHGEDGDGEDGNETDEEEENGHRSHRKKSRKRSDEDDDGGDDDDGDEKYDDNSVTADGEDRRELKKREKKMGCVQQGLSRIGKFCPCVRRFSNPRDDKTKWKMCLCGLAAMAIAILLAVAAIFSGENSFLEETVCCNHCTSLNTPWGQRYSCCGDPYTAKIEQSFQWCHCCQHNPGAMEKQVMDFQGGLNNLNGLLAQKAAMDGDDKGKNYKSCGFI